MHPALQKIELRWGSNLLYSSLFPKSSGVGGFISVFIQRSASHPNNPGWAGRTHDPQVTWQLGHRICFPSVHSSFRAFVLSVEFFLCLCLGTWQQIFLFQLKLALSSWEILEWTITVLCSSSLHLLGVTGHKLPLLFSHSNIYSKTVHCIAAENMQVANTKVLTWYYMTQRRGGWTGRRHFHRDRKAFSQGVQMRTRPAWGWCRGTVD